MTDLVTTAQAAKMLGKSSRTVQRLVKSGLLAPAFTAPGGQHGAYLFDRSEVERFLGQQVAA